MLSCKYCIRNLLKAVIDNSPSFSSLASSRPFSIYHRSYLRVRQEKLARLPQPVRPVQTKDVRQDRQRAVRKQAKTREAAGMLKYLEDPLKLANHVSGLLRQNKFEDALNIAQIAGKDRSATVSWNHLINHEMNRGRTTSALKIYNDMKKRAQTPDAYTYSLLFRGLARNAHLGRERAVQIALKVYDSMFNENSPVQPSVIHANAVLNVCSKALDVDAMFSVAARFPDKGPAAPDHASFTTILNTLYQSILQPLYNATEEQKVAIRDRIILQSRKIWADIVKRWAKKSLQVDERLVCAMGRLLLLGKGKDIDDILSLVDQTMRIRRLVPHLGDPTRPTHLYAPDKRLRAPGADPELVNTSEDVSDDGLNQDITSRNAYEDSTQLNQPSEFEPLPFSKTPTRLYPTPGPETLSLVMAACTEMRAYSEGQQYWEQLIKTVEPDQDNYHAYLRLLRSRRASTLAVDLVADMARSKANGGLQVGVAPKTFRIAMSACARDHMSMRTLKTATRLLSIMQTSVTIPDPDTIMRFTELIKKEDIRWPVQDVVAAADILFSLFANIRSIGAFGHLEEDEADRISNQPLSSSHEIEEAVESQGSASLSWADAKAKADAMGEILSPDLLGKGHITTESRIKLRFLGRRLETEFSRILRLYESDMAQREQRKITNYRYRVRDWMFRRQNHSPEMLQQKAELVARHREHISVVKRAKRRGISVQEAQAEREALRQKKMTAAA